MKRSIIGLIALFSLSARADLDTQLKRISGVFNYKINGEIVEDREVEFKRQSSVSIKVIIREYSSTYVLVYEDVFLATYDAKKDSFCFKNTYSIHHVSKSNYLHCLQGSDELPNEILRTSIDLDARRIDYIELVKK